MSTIKTRFLVISDTHTAELASSKETNQPFREPLPACDVLLHCGDLTNTGDIEEYKTTLSMLGSIPAELKLVIAGNHDLSLDHEWWLKNPRGRHISDCRHRPDSDHETARKLWTGDEAKIAGVTFLDEGTHSFKLKSGAKFTIYASPHTPEFWAWGFPYEHNQDRWNAPENRKLEGVVNITKHPVPSFPNVDIVMTHGPPFGILDKTTRREDVGCPHLLRAMARARPKIHCFGHIHEGWGAKLGTWNEKKTGADAGEVFEFEEDVRFDLEQAKVDRGVFVDCTENGEHELEFGKSTLFVNAAIKDVGYNTSQAPIVVDLDLSVG
jgi:predicted phosphohydrolase